MKVYAVIVTFNPDLDVLFDALLSICSQVEKVVLVDNSPRGLISIESHLNQQNVTVVSNLTNLGIATAQNIGMHKSFEQGADQVVLLDQDSNPPADLVSKLLLCQNRTSKKDAIPTVCGPGVFCLYEDRIHRSFWRRGVAENAPYESQKQLIASGLLISKEAYEHVGPMLDTLFIDAVDHEWCWRARKLGVEIYQSTEVFIEHRMGDGRYKVFGVWTKLTSPIRLYYQLRNTLWLLPVPYVPLYWKVRNIIAIPIKIALLLFLHPEKKRRLGYVFNGIKDGILGCREFNKNISRK